jgi:hypothetical protein
VNQGNPILFTELDQWLRPEGGSIVSDNPARATKLGKNVLQEADNYFMRSAPRGDSFYPLGEIVCCSQDPSVLAT